MSKINQYFKKNFIVFFSIVSSLLVQSCHDSGSQVHHVKINAGQIAFEVTDKRYAMNVNEQNELDTSKGFLLEIDMTVSNATDQTVKLDSSNFKLADETGTAFPFSSLAAMAFSAEKESLYGTSINAKSDKEGFLIFEVPARKNYKLYLKNISSAKYSGIIDLKD